MKIAKIVTYTILVPLGRAFWMSRESYRADLEIIDEPQLSIVAFRLTRRTHEPLESWNARNVDFQDRINSRKRVFLSSTLLPVADGPPLPGVDSGGDRPIRPGSGLALHTVDGRREFLEGGLVGGPLRLGPTEVVQLRDGVGCPFAGQILRVGGRDHGG